MDGQCGKESPVIQVHKWGISPFPFDLSQFREAFISPTRELLVLLSYQCEALLLPLVTAGDLINNKPETFDDQCHVNQPLEELCSESAEGFIRSEYKDDAPCTSTSGVNDEACTSKCRFSRYNDYSFLCDVKSLAWGACGSSYNHHKEALFRELLFVSSSNGVVVHAFREPDIVSLSTETVMPMLEGVHGQGNWVTWSPASIQNIAVSGSSGRTVSVVDVNKGIQPTESSTDSSEESEANQFLREDPSKIWLCSFSTTAETVISDGDVWTTFPDKASFPCSASVVSFKILDTDFPLRELSRVYENSNKKSNHIETVLFQETDIAASNSDTVSDSFGDGPFKCFRVFSSSSHNLIGFVLGLVESGLAIDEDEIPTNQMKNVVLVARLDWQGIQWVSLVKLMGCVNNEPVAEWVDFCFSDNLLVCLNAAGLVWLFDAMTGDGLANVNIFQACGLDPQSELTFKKKAQVLADGQIKAVDEVGRCSLLGVASGRRIFKKLLCASYNSMIAAVDEFGIIYVVCTGAHLSESYRESKQKVPLFQFSGPDMLFGYEVGGFHIGQQRDYTNMVKRNNQVPFSDSAGHLMTRNIQKWKQDCALDDCDLFLNGFSVGLEFPGNKCDSYENSRRMRKVFLSTERYSEEDCFSFSPLGITMLVKKKFGINQRSSRLINLSLQADFNIRDDTYLNPFGKHPIRIEEKCAGEAVGCTSQGWFYLVTETGISIVLPTALLSPSPLPAEPIGCLQYDDFTGLKRQLKGINDIIKSNQTFSPWKVEVLDRVLLNESHEEADRMCQENGWGLKISRLRRLQLALYYLKYDDIEQSLEMLRDVNLAEEGILKLLFAVAYLMVKGNDSDTSAASRLLALASRFTTKVIRSYGFLYCNKGADKSQSIRGTQMLCLPSPLPDEGKDETNDPGKLQEMANFLEIVRNLQYRISMKSRNASKGLADNGPALNFMDGDLSADERQLSIVSADAQSLDVRNRAEVVNFLSPPNHGKLALVSKEPSSSGTCFEVENGDGVSSIVVPQGIGLGKVENTKEMIARWKLDNLDTNSVVKDALMSGRLPLAVLQLHLYHSRDSNIDQKLPDTFSEVRHLGKSIAYDLFLKGETGLAVATLQKLGEDVESCLKQLLFGTVCKSLRIQIAEEMERYGYLGPYEWKILDRALLIERLYPSTGFWRVFHGRQAALTQAPEALNLPKVIALHLLCSSPFGSMSIECGEVDGVVLGSWTSINDHSPKAVDDEDFAIAGYWAAAAVWCNAWDQRTIDRIVLDQPFLMGVHILWDSQLEYFACHNDWEEVHKLIDIIPSSALLDGTLRVALDEMQNTPDVGPGDELLAYKNYICSIEEVDAVCIDVPDVKIFKFPANFLCSIWLRMLMEQELAKKLIFMKEYWEGITDIVTLLSRSGFVISGYCNTSIGDSAVGSMPELNALDPGRPSDATTQALHKLVVYHCVQCDLPNLLDLYLEYHKLVLDNDSLSYLQEAAGDSQWAKWLLLSRIKGREYDASFCNARSVLTRSAISDNNLSVLEVDERIHTVDDIAEGESEMAAIATLMHAPEPIQNCLSRGSINRQGSSSAQCTLENLKSALQLFPTLWRTLVAACFGQDASVNFFGSSGNNALSDYLNWRANIFLSSTHDTSLLQMLPCWLPKAVRRLIQLYIQGPLGWQSFMGVPSGDNLLNREIDFCVHADENTEITPISWEATIHKLVADELYSPSLKESGAGLEHHLHRGRAFAAFNQILGVRVQKFKSEEPSGSQPHGQTNVQLDVQTLLSPLSYSEEALLSIVTPLAITHFEDSKLVASCAFLLELCGLSASMLHIDIAALRRISSSYKSDEKPDLFNQFSPRGSAFHLAPHESDIIDSLARSLADEYLHKDCVRDPRFKGRSTTVRSQSPSRALILVLQHLEKASLPSQVDGKTCGSWLSTGDGDGAELRSKQKAASQYWTLVTLFCQTHLLPISTKYLALLANDNDWVGFLAEAQMGGFPFAAVVQVATNEFNDSRLRIHILNVLRGMHSRKKACSPSGSDSPYDGKQSFITEQTTLMPAELFRILAECEKNKCPGEVLLKKAKEMSWSVLAMIASCFSDVSSLSCLTVWLEITAARETSSIKVNDLASQVAFNVRAAVEATNELPAASRGIAFHCNRRNPKRRRLLEPFSEAFVVSDVDVSSTQHGTTATVPGVATAEGRNLEVTENITVSCDFDEGPASLSKMVAVLCEQRLFLPLLRAFEMFLPSCSLLPFIRALQAFSQMRLSEASAHLGSFSARIKDESSTSTFSLGREGQVGASWISSTAVKASDAVLLTCPSPYEKRCLLQLLASTDFGDGGSTATCYRRQYMKINLAEPSLRKDNDLHLGDEVLDDSALLTALEKNGHWEQARNWARQLETSGGPWKSAVHHVTETQVESMVAEWKEFLWDVPEERVALWGHCQTLFIRYSFPPLQAGLFFLKHAEAVEKDLPARELLELLLLSLQWLSGMITLHNPVYPMHLLREIETKVWLLAVESEAQIKSDRDFTSAASSRDSAIGNSSNMIDRTASLITKMDNHINAMRNRSADRYETRDTNFTYQKSHFVDSGTQFVGGSTKTKRRVKGHGPSRRALTDGTDRNTDIDDGSSSFSFKNDFQLQDENINIEISISKWEESVAPEELERAVLSLLEFGQITASKQLQHKLSPTDSPLEFKLIDAALKLAAIATTYTTVSLELLDDEVQYVVRSNDIPSLQHPLDPMQILEKLVTVFTEGSGRGLCKRIIAVVKVANVLGLSFAEAFDKQPIELLRLLSLKAQESFDEASLLVQTHSMPAASIAQILAESFLKGLLAAHRGGYIDSQKEEGPSPLLWRFSDFLKWADLCPSKPEIGHSLMRLVITGQEVPHACEVELLILSHHFYKSSACLDGVDVLVALAATRVEAYVSEGDFPCLARLITGVGNFHALNFILGILIENGQLDLLLQKYSTVADTSTGTAEAVRGFRMAVLTSLKHFNHKDLDAFAMVYNHFDMKHETAALLESRSWQSSNQWFGRYDKDHNEDLLESMRYFIEAAEVYSSIDAGNKTRRACAQASLVSLQIRMPDSKWLNLSETNARRLLVEQSRFQEALIVAEAYGLNQPTEWALVLWNQMLKPELIEEFVAEFVAVLPLQSTMLIELARFYRAEVAARGDQSQFSVWLTGGGLPAEWAKYLGRSFRCLLKRTRDLRLRLQLATIATGFGEIVDGCTKVLDKVPENAGPLVLRKGHGGAYLPLM